MALRGVFREPSPNDPWFRRHQRICGGVYAYCGDLALGDPLPELEPEPEPMEQPVEAPMEGPAAGVVARRRRQPAEPRPCRVLLRRLEEEETLPVEEVPLPESPPPPPREEEEEEMEEVPAAPAPLPDDDDVVFLHERPPPAPIVLAEMTIDD